jgi:hypothetical protein
MSKNANTAAATEELQDLCTRMMQKLAGVHLIKTSMNKLAQIGVVSREKAMMWAA